MRLRRTSLAIALLLPLLVPTSASAFGIPGDGKLEFTVMRNGSEIGTHVITFRESGSDLFVSVRTDIAVRIPVLGIALYHFTHQGTETWRDNELRALVSKTDDDGNKHSLMVQSRGDDLLVESDVTKGPISRNAVPGSLWNDAVTRSVTILNTLDGTSMKVSTEDLGKDQVEAAGKTTAARHFRITGDLRREVWYDSAGVLVRVRFTGKDDSDIQYVLK